MATGSTDSQDRPHGPRRRALVTGASSGIGEAFARRLAHEGYDLVVVARRVAALEGLSKSLHDQYDRNVEVIAADLVRPEERARVEERLGAEPKIDLLVNNAGFGAEGVFAESDVDTQAAMIHLNVEALVRLTHAALGPMLARGSGAVINVSSGTAFFPTPYFDVYAATKAFVNQFTEGLAEELRGSGVRVQCLCPGFTRTEFQARAGTDASRIPSFMWMEPDDVVEASLEALQRGTLVVIPGAMNRMSGVFLGNPVRRPVGRLFGALQRRFLRSER